MEQWMRIAGLLAAIGLGTILFVLYKFVSSTKPDIPPQRAVINAEQNELGERNQLRDRDQELRHRNRPQDVDEAAAAQQELIQRREARRKAYEEKIEKRRLEREKVERDLLEQQLQKEQQEKELYQQWRTQFGVSSEGTEIRSAEDEIDLQESIRQQLIDEKVVDLMELAASHGIHQSDCISIVSNLQQNGSIMGVFDDRGRFICVSSDDLNRIQHFIVSQGRVRITDLARESARLLTNSNV